MESDAQLVSSEFPIGVRLGSDQETYLATESLSPCSRFFIIRHIHNHTSIISSEMQVELKKNTAFT